MQTKLVFQDWVRNGGSIYNTNDGIRLSAGDLHSGSTFDAEVIFQDGNIALEIDQAATLEDAHPVFSMHISSKNNVQNKKHKNVNWKKLREKFFQECTCIPSHSSTDTQITLKKFVVSPDDVFDWFRCNVNVCKIT